MTPEELQTLNEGAIVSHKNGKRYVAEDVRDLFGTGHRTYLFRVLVGGRTQGTLRKLKPEAITLVKNAPRVARYQLDETPDAGTFTWEGFVENNPEFADAEEAAPILKLQVGECYRAGGGAQAEWTIRRVE